MRARSRLDRLRPWAVLAAVPVTLGMAGVGGGLIGGFAVEQSSGGALSSAATPLAPGGPAFSIWSVIYLGLAAYAVWQVLPRHREDPRTRRIGWLAVASLVLNAVWILCALAGLLPLTVVVILLLLVVLAAIIELLRRGMPRSTAEALLVDGTFGLYLGWVCVATVANIAAWLADVGVRPLDFAAPTVLVLGVVVVVAAAVALRTGGRVAPSLAIIWGLAWIGVARITGEPTSLVVTVAAALACVAVGAVTVATRLGRGPRRATL